jgi:Helix-turn-helix domain
MSIKVVRFVLERRDLTAPQKAVAFAMAWHAHEDGSGCYPSMDTLARESGYKSRRGVQLVVRSLEKKGLIAALEGYSKGGLGKALGKATTRYSFLLDGSAPENASSQAPVNCSTPTHEPRFAGTYEPQFTPTREQNDIHPRTPVRTKGPEPSFEPKGHREPSIQPDVDGWLVEHLCKILGNEQDTVIIPTASERSRLRAIENEYGAIAVLLGLLKFTQRNLGVRGLHHPVHVFLEQARPWILKALSDASEPNSQHHAGVVQTICANAGLDSSSDPDRLLLTEMISSFESEEDGIAAANAFLSQRGIGCRSALRSWIRPENGHLDTVETPAIAVSATP